MRFVSFSLFLLITGACSGSSCGKAQVKVSGAEKSALAAGKLVVFEGACDGSAAVALSPDRMAVADDEENVLRVYDPMRGGPALATVDLTAALAQGGHGKKSKGEADLEGAARLDDLTFWVGSHGRGATGKPKPERQVLVATRADATLEPVGTPYRSLLSDLVKDPRYARFALDQAAELAPKQRDALNIEGLGLRSQGGLWLGFRSPLPEDKALLAALLNPREVVQGTPAQLGDFALLDLGGRGVRALVQRGAQVLIVAGSYGDERPAQLYVWDEQSPPRALAHDLSWLNPEAMFVTDARKEVLLLSDDGTREIDGVECKEAKDSAHRRFRGLWLALPDDT